jgi:hypothetical protein
MRAGAIRELTLLAVTEEHRHEGQCAIDHGRIDNLAAPELTRFQLPPIRSTRTL